MDRQIGGGVDPNTGLFVQGDPQNGVTGSQPGAPWANGLTEEMRNAIVFAGLTPDPDNWDQLRHAMSYIAALRPALANLVFNGGMRIWQRGTTASNVDHEGQYTADRWFAKADGAAGPGIAQIEHRTVGSDGSPPEGIGSELFFNQTVAALNGPPTLRYRLEDVRLTEGRTITVSWWQRLPTGSFSVQLNVNQMIDPGNLQPVHVGTEDTEYLPSTTDWTRHSYTFTVPGLAGATPGPISYLDIEWALPSGSTFAFQMTQVQVEYGDVATPYSHRPEMLERSLCARYFQTSYPEGVDPGTPGAPGPARALDSHYDAEGLQERFAVEMRAAPTMMWFGPVTGTVGRLLAGSTESSITGTVDASPGTTGYPSLQNYYATPINMAVHWTAEAEL